MIPRKYIKNYVEKSFMVNGIKKIFSPYFFVRYYIERDIKLYVRKYTLKGKLLDVGCGQKPYRSLFVNSDYLGIDFKKYSKQKEREASNPDFFFNESYSKTYRLPFAECSFDNTVAFQVVEHHPRPDIFIPEIIRVTKSKGFILLSIPFIAGLHEIPNDYSRPTKFMISNYISQNGGKVIRIIEEGGLMCSALLLFVDNLNNFASRSKINYLISVVIMPIVVICEFLFILADTLFPNKLIYPNYFVVAQKK